MESFRLDRKWVPLLPTKEWAEFVVDFRRLTKDDYVELNIWCKENLKSKWYLNTDVQNGFMTFGIAVLYIETEDDLLLVKLRW